MRLAPVGRVSGLPRNPPINTFPAALRLLAYNRRVTPAANPPYEKLRP